MTKSTKSTKPTVHHFKYEYRVTCNYHFERRSIPSGHPEATVEWVKANGGTDIRIERRLVGPWKETLFHDPG